MLELPPAILRAPLIPALRFGCSCSLFPDQAELE